METRLLASEFLGKCGVLWYEIVADIEAFQLHLVTTTYGEGAGASEKAECWTVVIKIVQVIWREIRKVSIEAETAYGPDNMAEMVGQYLREPYRRIRLWMTSCGSNYSSILRWLHTSRYTFSDT